MTMQGSIADSADQDQKRVVTLFTVRSGLAYPFLIFGFILPNELFYFTCLACYGLTVDRIVERLN